MARNLSTRRQVFCVNIDWPGTNCSHDLKNISQKWKKWTKNSCNLFVTKLCRKVWLFVLSCLSENSCKMLAGNCIKEKRGGKKFVTLAPVFQSEKLFVTNDWNLIQLRLEAVSCNKNGAGVRCRSRKFVTIPVSQEKFVTRYANQCVSPSYKGPESQSTATKRQLTCNIQRKLLLLLPITVVIIKVTENHTHRIVTYQSAPSTHVSSHYSHVDAAIFYIGHPLSIQKIFFVNVWSARSVTKLKNILDK